MGKEGGKVGRLTRVRVDVDEMVRIVDVRVRGDGDGDEDAAAEGERGGDKERDGRVEEMRIVAEEGEREEIDEGKVDTGIGEGDIEAEVKAEDSDSVVVV